MFVHMRFQHRLAPERYDQFLAAGWFRGASMLYRMDLMCIDGAVNSVINVRLPLAGFSPDRRQRKLISKIDAALRRLEEGTYGFCEDTGDPISLRRLEARPIATLSLEAQERHERRERVYRDD